MMLFSKSLNKVRRHTGKCPNQQQRNICSLDTDPGLNIINSRLIQSNCTYRIKCPSTSKLQNVVKKPTTLLRTILFFVQIGNLHVNISLGMAETMGVRYTSRKNFYRPVRLENIFERLESRSMAFGPGTHPPQANDNRAIVAIER